MLKILELLAGLVVSLVLFTFLPHPIGRQILWNGIKRFWRILSSGFTWAFSLCVGSLIEAIHYNGVPEHSFQHSIAPLMLVSGVCLAGVTGVIHETRMPKQPKLSKKGMKSYEIDVLAQQFDLPNPKIEEIEAEERARVALIEKLAVKDPEELENEDKSFTFHADMCTCGDCTFGQIEYIDRWREPVKNLTMSWYLPNDFLSELEKIDQQVKQIGEEIEKMAREERRKTEIAEISFWEDTHPGHMYTQILGDDQEIHRRCEECD